MQDAAFGLARRGILSNDGRRGARRLSLELSYCGFGTAFVQVVFSAGMLMEWLLDNAACE
jgi:hypothetical protein